MWKTVLITALAIAGSAAILTTVLPFIREEQWWIRIWDFPRLQIAILCAGVIIIWLFVWSPRSAWQTTMLVAVAASMAYQLFRIFPYTTLASMQAAAATGEPRPEHTISLLISNVLMENRQVSKLVDVIAAENPDVVFAVETDAWWQAQLDDALSTTYPYTVSRPLDNTYGLLLYSRLPLANTTIRELARKNVPSLRTELLLSGGRSVLFYGLHPPPPFPGIADESIARDAELVIVGREAKAQPLPVIVAGDLNDVAWSDTTTLFQRLSGLLDPRIGRGMYNTYHAHYFFARWPLDHAFFSEEFAVVTLKRLPAIGSDHFPLLITLQLTEQHLPHDEPEPADADTQETADEKLEEEAESDGDDGF